MAYVQMVTCLGMDTGRTNQMVNPTDMSRLHLVVFQVIKAMYQFLANPELVKKCSHGRTQNCNKILRKVIRKCCPKVVFVLFAVVKTTTYDTVLVFNDGNTRRIKTLELLGFIPKILQDFDDIYYNY